MSFPQTYKNNICFDYSDSKNIDAINSSLIKNLKLAGATNFKFTENTIHFNLKKSILHFKYSANFKIINDKERLKIEYEFSLIPVFEISLFVIIFSLFASNFSVYSLIKFSIIFLIIFYSVNIFFISNELRKLIKASYFSLFPENNSDYSKEQQEWINNPNKCPACGEYINEYSLKCINCGLTLKHGKRIKSTTDQTFGRNKKITYHYKKTK
ncbi:MAG: hypothetical protein IMY72_05780 [Bacteroidetes bacterium]|nr:hypothetical protein [Bacteroidota bacterium]